MNDSLWIAGQIACGLLLLLGGGEFLVRGAVSLAAALKISPLVIGLTVVAFGTSAPELGVSLQAALSGNADVAVGNVVGSNIMNVLLILGASALVTPLVVSSQLIRLDVPLMIGACVAMWIMAASGTIERWEGALLFAALVVYILFSIRKSRSEHQDVVDEFALEYSESALGVGSLIKQIGWIVLGLVLLGFGSNWLVGGAVTVATRLGVSELVIGLTVVAVGTSMPEAVTSVVASFRGQRDIAVGNVVGSNLFNVLCVLGLTSVVSPTGVPVADEAIAFDIPVMVAVAVLCFPIFLTGSVIRRWEGALFLTYLFAYTTFLVLAATRSPQGETFGQIVGFVVVPLTVFAIALSFYQSKRKPDASRTANRKSDIVDAEV